MDSVVEVIQIVGFPTVMCLLMFWMANTTIKENTQAIRELTTKIGERRWE